MLVSVAVLAGLAGCASRDADDPEADRPGGGEAPPEYLEPSRLVAAFPEPGGDVLIESAIDLAVRDAEVLVLDGLAQRVLRFDLSGRLLGALGRPGQGPGELSGAVSVRATAEGRVWVSATGNLRMTAFAPSGELAEERRTPFAISAFAVAGPDPVIPTADPAIPLARLTADSDTVGLVRGAIPAPLARSPGRRLAFRGSLLAASGDRIWMLQNHGADRFALWRFEASSAEGGAGVVERVRLPAWLRDLLQEEAASSRERLRGAARHLEMIPFKGMHVDDEGRVWLNPDPSHRAIAISPSEGPGSGTRAVVSSERGEHRGLLQAAVWKGHLVALYATQVRVYELGPRSWSGGPRPEPR